MRRDRRCSLLDCSYVLLYSYYTEPAQGCYPTMRIRLQNELLLVNILTILFIIIVTLFPSNVLRIVLGLPFVLCFPGYTLIAALFPRRNPVDSIERVALSFGLSIAVVPLIGLILNYTPWGIRLYPILISLAVFIFLTSIIAWYQRRRLPEVERPTVSFNLSLTPWKGQNFVDKVLSVILIAAIVGVIGTLVYVIATPKTGERFAEFYVIGLEGKATDYPSELNVGEAGKVIVGVTSHEKAEASYRVEVRIDGVKNSEAGPIVLGDEQKWEEIVSFSPDRAEDNQKVEFLLYKNEGSEAYARIHLWVNVKE